MIELIENTKDIDELEFINSFSHSGKPVKDLSRIKALLSDLGDPQDSLKFVHIAGTNGKGSMAQMFSEVFQDRKSTRLNSSHIQKSRMPSSA